MFLNVFVFNTRHKSAGLFNKSLIMPLLLFQLIDITGKDQDESMIALHDCNGDVNRAINVLLEGSPDTVSIGFMWGPAPGEIGATLGYKIQKRVKMHSTWNRPETGFRYFDPGSMEKVMGWFNMSPWEITEEEQNLFVCLFSLCN